MILSHFYIVLTYAIFSIPVKFATGRAGTFVATWGIYTSKLATSLIDTTFINICRKTKKYD